MNKAVFLDRDGVLNYDSPGYVYRPEEFELYPDVTETLAKLKKMGFLMVVITNQAGISRGIYERQQMQACHKKLLELTEGIVDIFYSPYHPTVTECLSRKPSTLMFQRAAAKWDIDFKSSWMVGDKPSDIEPAELLKMKTIGVRRGRFIHADFLIDDFSEVLSIIQNNA